MDLGLIEALPTAASGGGEHAGPGFFGLVFYVGLVLGIIGLLIWRMRAGLGERVFKNPVTQLSEQMFLFVDSMCVNIIGPRGRKYVTFIGTLWMVIFIGNSVALFFPTSPTADLSFNLAMALMAVSYVQYEGIKSHADHLRAHGAAPLAAWVQGLFRHLRHFAGPRMSGVIGFIMPWVLFPIELISELMKNVSLSLRLFGNIHGGHTAVESLNAVGKFTLWGTEWYVPLGGLLLAVKLLTVVVQALVFTLLTCVYLSLVLHHDEGHGEAHAGQPAMAH
jgi:F-type H+-transporting ATPase subunit a